MHECCDELPALLAEIEKLGAGGLERSGALDTLCARLTALLGAGGCALWLRDEQGTALLLAASHRASGRRAASLRQRVTIAAHEPLEQALAADASCEFAPDDPRAISAALGAPDGVALPLRTSQAPLGLLSIWPPPGEGAVSGPAMNSARIVAAFLGQAISGARAAASAEANAAHAVRLSLVQETARALAETTSLRELCATLARTLRAYLGQHLASVYLREGETLRLTACSLDLGAVPDSALRLPMGVGIVGHVAASGEPYICGDTRTDPRFHQASDTGTRSEIAAPMFVGADLLGVLNVESRTPDSFDEPDVATLAAISDQAAIAIQNVRLYETEAELRRRAQTRARRIEQVQRVGERLKMDLDEHEVGVRVVEAASEALGFRMAVLNLTDTPGEPGARGRVVATAGLPLQAEEALYAHDFAMSAVEAMFHPVCRISRSYFIPEEMGLTHDQNEVTVWTPALANMGDDAWRSGDELLVPLTDRQGGHLIGFLSVDDPESGRRPEREDVELLEIFADQAVVALRNARLMAQARRQAERDPVTGLYNHRAAHARLEAGVRAALETGQPLGLIALDMDDFKLINDTYGHPTGDMALRHVAGLLEHCARSSDTAARMGGDEFVLILPGASQAHSVEVARRLLSLLQDRPLHIEGAGYVPLRLSVGVAACPDDANQPHTLLTTADTRLYEAKRAGGRTLEAGLRPEQEAAELAGFDMLSALVTTVDNKDRYTREHSEQVAALACALADRLCLSTETHRTLRLAGLLHDVGKIGVPDRVLRKPGKLDPEEWEAMKQHAALSATLVRAVVSDANVLAAVAHHHERWDGRGYPQGLAGSAVPLLGRIMIVADAVSAMAMDRPYRSGLSRDTIIAELRRGAGQQFDPALVEPFIQVLEAIRGAVA